MDGDDVVIRCEGLCRDFGDLKAVKGVDLEIRRGEIYGFLGPNGAGKTTTVRLLTTMDRPTSGKIWIDGHDTSTEYLEARRRLGIIQQQHSLDKDISVRENIMHHALMQGMSRAEGKAEMMRLCETLELTDRLDSVVEDLSGGWKKRVAIVCSMIHSPEILFMDEPTTGLDTQSRNMLWKMIRALNRGGTTIFLTTHYIYEAEALCDRIGMIDHGEIIAGGSPRDLIDSVGRYAAVRSDEDGNVVGAEFFHDRSEAEAEAAKYDSFTTIVRRSTLEDVYLRLTGGMERRTTSSARPAGSRTATCAS